jgi:sensor histidine kinase YesM
MPWTKSGSGLARWLREAGTLLLFCAALTFALSLIWVMFRGIPSLKYYGYWLIVGMTFSVSIGGLSTVGMPWFARLVWRYHPVVKWVLLLASFVVLAMVGCFLANVVLWHVFDIRMARSFPVMFRETLKTSTVVTVVIGVTMTLLEAYRERLQATELKLKTQELERERAEKVASEAKLASLSSRVQPHFLFNTLNSVSALIRDDPEQAERMIERLSALLRSSLDSAETITLAQELKLVSDFLEIQSARFGGRLRFELPAEIPEASVPPFSVQTLVENSVKHVGGASAEGVSVRVSARRDGESVVVDVSDDGPGFEESAILAGHGIDTLQARLRSLYGERARLEFIRGGRMTVRLRVPA